MKIRTITITVSLLIGILSMASNCHAVHYGEKHVENKKLTALIIDGQNNHKIWPKSTVMMKGYLEQSGLFKVDVYRTKPVWRADKFPAFYQRYATAAQYHVEKPVKDPKFSPKFSDYDVVISNFGHNTAAWPKKTEKAFESYMKNGGGFVSVHAADNAFGRWLAYNKMIGVGGWGGRSEKNGPHLYYDDTGKLVRDNSKGKAGTHGKRHQLTITKRNYHPIVAGLPEVWLQAEDECYGNLRGPANNMLILATAYCPKNQKGTGNNEPALMTISYGKGRIFHTTLGHDEAAFSSVGFITTLQRGAEWAATGKVSQKVPSDFPNAHKSSTRVFEK